MPFKFTSYDESIIETDTFVDAPSSADVEINIRGKSKVTAKTVYKVQSREDFFRHYNIPRDSITDNQMLELLEFCIEKKQPSSAVLTKEKVFEWINSTAAMATLTGGEPISIIISAILATGLQGLEHLKQLFSESK